MTSRRPPYALTIFHKPLSIEVTSSQAPAAAIHDAFLCYSREDSAFADAVARALADRGRLCWVDRTDSIPTAAFRDDVDAAIERANSLVFVLSRASIRSEECRRELAVAQSVNKRLVPVLLTSVPASEVPEPLRTVSWTPRSGPFSMTEHEFSHHCDELVEALDVDVGWVRLHTALLVAAREWDRDGRTPSRMLQGRALRLAKRWLRGATPEHAVQPIGLQIEFIEASVRRERHRRAGGVASAGALVAAAAMTRGHVGRLEFVNRIHDNNLWIREILDKGTTESVVAEIRRLGPEAAAALERALVRRSL